MTGRPAVARAGAAATFRTALAASDFTVTAELPLAPGTTPADVAAAAATLGGRVDALEMGDNASATPHMSPLAAAALVLRNGMDAVVHLGCRDRNRIALQSDLMGAAALGVTSLVLYRGEKLPATLKQQVKGVFDIGTQRLLATARAVGANPRLVAPPGFLLGTNVAVIEPPDDWAADGIATKIAAGCSFLQTQPCLDAALLRRYANALIARNLLEKVSLIVRVPLPASLAELEALGTGRRRLVAAPGILERLRAATEYEAEAQAVCRNMLEQAAAIPGIAGACICAGRPAAVAQLAARLSQ